MTHYTGQTNYASVNTSTMTISEHSNQIKHTPVTIAPKNVTPVITQTTECYPSKHSCLKNDTSVNTQTKTVTHVKH